LQNKITYSLLPYFFLIVFQFPNWIQLEHITHEHELRNQTCEKHELENHIHTNIDDSCMLLHKQVNPILEIVVINYQSLKSSLDIIKPNTLVVAALKQLINYTSLRAPPTIND